jgi:putative transposase
MQMFNKAANYVASVAFAEKSANKIALQKVVYGDLRTTYKLPSQLAIRCISKASEAYKQDKSIQPAFRPEGAIVYDERVMSFKGLTHVSLLTLSGRVLIPFLIGDYQRARVEAIKGQADLIYRKGTFFLAVTLDVPSPEPFDSSDVLGVDPVIVPLAKEDQAYRTGAGYAKSLLD